MKWIKAREAKQQRNPHSVDFGTKSWILPSTFAPGGVLKQQWQWSPSVHLSASRVSVISGGLVQYLTPWNDTWNVYLFLLDLVQHVLHFYQDHSVLRGEKRALTTLETLHEDASNTNKKKMSRKSGRKKREWLKCRAQQDHNSSVLTGCFLLGFHESLTSPEDNAV